jgi:hypothetical protein
MQQCLREEQDEKQSSGKRSKAIIYWSLAIAALIVLAGWTTWRESQKRQFESRVVDLFRNQPGYVVSSSQRQNGALLIDGLRDPATPDPGAILTAQGLPDQDIQFRFKPFMSLEPALVLQGLRTSLGLEDSTGLSLNGRILIVNGVIQSDQEDKLTRLAGAHPMINAVDLSGTRLSAEDALRLARSQLGAPGTVELTVENDRIMVAGSSDIDWYLEQSGDARQFGGWETDFGPLLVNLQDRLRTEAAELSKLAFYFTRLDRLSTDSAAELKSFAQNLAALSKASSALGMDTTITLTGQVDGTGTAEQNALMSRKRINVVQDMLIGNGIDPSALQSEYLAWKSGGENLSNRCVTVRISLESRQ